MPLKEKLIILSDLWGQQHNAWVTQYLSVLEPMYQVEYLDACQLAQMPPGATSQVDRHQHFVNGGIDLAVQQLTDQINSPITVLAFSIWGTLAWKAGLQGVPIRRLYAVSASRLRYESQKPSFPIQLVYGSLDPYRPKQEWLERMDLPEKIIANVGHDFYTQASHIPDILIDFKIFIALTSFYGK